MPRSSLRDAGAAHEIVSFARERIGSGGSVHYAPSIPPRKEARARRTHALHLPEGEPILVLYDATILGGADEGFVITPERLCWRNFLEHPRQIAWKDIDPAGVTADGGSVRVAGGRIAVVGGGTADMAAVIAELAARGAVAHAGPYRASAEGPADTARGSLLAVSRLVALARRHLGEVDGVFYFPNIPPRKLDQARRTHAAHLPADEEIAVLYDDTLFGSAAEGFVLTTTRLCWKNLAGDPEMVAWHAIEADQIMPNGNRVEVAERPVYVAIHPELAPPVALLLSTIARADRERA